MLLSGRKKEKEKKEKKHVRGACNMCIFHDDLFSHYCSMCTSFNDGISVITVGAYCSACYMNV